MSVVSAAEEQTERIFHWLVFSCYSLWALLLGLVQKTLVEPGAVSKPLFKYNFVLSIKKTLMGEFRF